MLDRKYRAYTDEGKALTFEAAEYKGIITLTLPKEKLKGVRSITLFPEISSARVGDEGFYILPRNISMRGDIYVRFEDREDTVYTYDKPIMSLYGICKNDFCALVRIERNYKYSFRLKCENGEYTVAPVIRFGGRFDPVYDDVRVELIKIDYDKGLSAFALAERTLRLERGEITLLSDKCKEREVVEYSRKNPLIRIRMGWKPSPSPVKHQTVENEPEMFTACTFARVRDIADELKAQGVEGADLQLVGWNIGGHDGRFPQLFPIDERLGGESEFKRTAEYVKSLGYRISTHTNWIDAYEIANTFTWDDICKDEDGEYLQIGSYSGGHAYHVCLAKQLKNSMRSQPRLASLGENGLHFTDVISIVEPDTCHSPDHPVYTSEAIKYAQAIMTYEKGLFGGFSSEGCFDFAVGCLDYGLYVSFGDGFGRKEVQFASRFVPFFEMIYHGIILYNPTSPTVNFPIKTPEDRLTFIMRGGRPSFYFYSKFRTGGHANWMGNTDLICDTDESLRESVKYIKEGCDEYRTLADKQLLHIISYEFAEEDGKDSGIEVAHYSDGSRIVGNFSDEEKTYEGIALAPYSWCEIKR